jgi:hypothetical protein
MNQTSPTDDLRTAPVDENLDRLLSHYFKSKMQQPWPKAPATPSRMSEPSALAASRTGANAPLEAPRNQPVSSSDPRNGGNKSRYTLAASVAVLLGACWALSNGFQPGAVPAGNNGHKLNVFPEATAEKPAVGQQIQKDKAENGDQGGTPRPKFQFP